MSLTKQSPTFEQSLAEQIAWLNTLDNEYQEYQYFLQQSKQRSAEWIEQSARLSDNSSQNDSEESRQQKKIQSQN